MATAADIALNLRGPVYFRRVPCGRCEGRGYVERARGSDLRKLRLAAGLSLRGLASRLKLTASYLCDIELDRRRATSAIVIAYLRLR